ncbi:MAG TPA: hypothetical protein VHI11_10945 [Jiangellaceae bacterium]|nr:hypothetical protein [Jiangellaceae bacterium]
MTAPADLVFANGIDATTGELLLPPITVEELARLATNQAIDRAESTELAARHRRVTEQTFAPKHGVDPADLAQTGWGVVFAEHSDPRLVTALTPLLVRRHAQAGAVIESRYREFSGGSGYRKGESKQEFLRRFGSGPGPVDPDVVPYYLLLVGGPDEIPFEVQYQLDVQHAVGRIHFDDVASYARYARNVVAAETGAARTESARLSFFAARNDDDPATALSCEQLVTPLATDLGNDWLVRSFLGADATKDGLCALLSGEERPDVLFTATHGVGFPAGHDDQRRMQGALVCQDWPGPGHGLIAPEHWFGPQDVPDADLTGMIAVLFACFGAGTPRYDDFDRSPGQRTALAPDPFVAALPQALLGRDGGALAVVGHVDRALGYSFVWPGAGRQTEVYRSTLAELREGAPIGSALEYVGDRYAELATDLKQAVDDATEGWRADDAMLAGLFAACADARGFVLLGDPAVRLATAPAEGFVPRSAPITVSAAVSATGRREVSADETADETAAEPATLSPARDDPVEVATYVTDDPDGVAYDAATGRISGARLCLFSSVDLDGTAAHVTTTPVPGADDEALTRLHTRLVEISVDARRASRRESGRSQ